MKVMVKFLRYKSLFFSLLVIGFLFSTVISPILAEEPTSTYNPENWVDRDITEDGKARDAAALAPEGAEIVNLEVMVDEQVRQTMCGFSSAIYVNPCTTQNEDRKQALGQTTALAAISNLIASTYTNPPASSTYYVYDLLHNAGLVPKAYAQGIGFSGLIPILPLWKAFRNIAYMLIVVILIVIGFMIMFRMKINPQTVISIQSALPRIAITLLLITFSYAIAGFLIDLMYLSIMLVIAVFGQTGLIKNVAGVQEHYLTGEILNLFGAVFGPGLASVSLLISKTVKSIGIALAVSKGLSLLLVAQIPTSIIGGVMGGLLSGGVAAVLLVLIIGLALLFVFLKILMMLGSAYLQIIIAIIFGPLQIVMGAFPGAGGFRSWFLSLLSNIIVFPATAALLILASILSLMPSTENLWTPPMLIGNLGGGIRGLLAIGVLSLIPSMVGSIKKAFNAAPMLPVGVSSMAGMAAQPLGAGMSLMTSLKMAGMAEGLPGKSLWGGTKQGEKFEPTTIGKRLGLGK